MKCVLEYLENNKSNNLIVDKNGAISYEILLENSKKIGSFLVDKINKNDPVPVFMEKSKETLGTFLGILYAGGFYSLLNTSLPKSRLDQIMSVLEVNYLITDKENEEMARTYFSDKEIYLYEDIINTKIDEEKLLSVRKNMVDVDPVYANFTSGSTGVPKGVLVSNRSIIDFIENFTTTFNFTDKDVIGNQAPFDFDVSVKDIYTALKTGATLVIIPKELFINPAKLIDCLIDNKVTSLTWAVSALCFITTFHGFDYKIPSCVKKVLFSGEVMPFKHLSLWMESLPDAMFVNLYGPTEITCNCTYHIIDKNITYDKIPIGVPFNNEEVFLIDESNKKIEQDNKKGEICIRGTALALGYYNNLEQTNKMFCQNPLHNKYLDMVYKTGDIGYYENDNLYFAGRKDFQIKHLGHRIELEEIDKRIGAIDGVKRAVTIYLKEKSKLCTFYIGDIDSKEIKHILKSDLPVYMMPGKLVKLDDLPLSKNGKIDRKKLEEYI